MLQPTFDLPELLLNSKYRVVIETRDAKNNIVMSSIEFKTPKCLDTNRDFKQCRDPVPTETGKEGYI